MNCEECQSFLDAYHDNELDAAGALAIEQHLQRCRRCWNELRTRQTLQALLRRPELRYVATEETKARVTAVLERRVGKEEERVPVSRKIIPFWVPWAIAAAFAIFAGLSWWQPRNSTSVTGDASLVSELAASHARSLQPNHLLDVASSDQNQVEPWFAAKVSYTPPIWESKEHQFQLLGGRLDYIDKRTVSALVYHFKGHLINVFIWPSKIMSELEGTPSASGDFCLIQWRKNGMICWAISDASPEVLKEFYEQVDEA